MTIPEPHRSELLTEIIGGFRAVADVFRFMRETPPNWERVGAALDELDAVVAALQEINEQQEGE